MRLTRFLAALAVLPTVLLTACPKEDPPPVPVVSAVTPLTGLTSGGEDITISGQYFDKTSEVKVGGTAATNVRVNNGQTIVATTPAHARGAVKVEVTTPGGTGGLDSAFTYLQPVTVTALEPTMVQALRTTPIIVRGTGLVAPVTVQIGEGATAVTVIARDGNDSAVPVDIPSLMPGSYTIRVTNADEQTALSAIPLTVTPAPMPSVGNVLPNRGPESGGTSVRIQGQNFAGVTEVRFGTAVAVNPQINQTGTEIVVNSPLSTRGLVDVSVTTASGTGTLPGAFRYFRPIAVTALDPPQVLANTTSNINVRGTGLVEPVTVRLANGVDEPLDLVVNEQDEQTVVAVIPPLPSGDYNLTAINADGESGAAPAALRVRAGLMLDGVFPTAGFTDESTTLEITGPDLAGVSDVLVGGNACTNLQVLTTRRVRCEAPPANAGTVDVVVRKAAISEGTLASAFTYVSPSDPTVRVLNVDPGFGPNTGNVNVEVAATGLSGGAPVVTFAGVQATVVGATARRVTVSLPPRTISSSAFSVRVPVGVTVGASSDEQAGAFLYHVPATISAINPTKGATVGNDLVTITGAGFTEEGLRVFFDSAEATQVMRVSATQLTCRIPAHALGFSSVTVHNEFGPGVTGNGIFEYVEAVRITSVDPAEFSPAGNTIVEAVGSGFAEGRMDLRIVEGNTVIPVEVLSATRLRFTTPAHAAGSVTLRLQDTARMGQPFSSGDFTVSYVDRTITEGGVTGGTIRRNVNVTVLREDTRARLSNVTVFIGDSYANATYRGTTNASGMLVLSGLTLGGPITLTAAGTNYANETIVGLDASHVTFLLTPRVATPPTSPQIAQLNGAIVNWDAAGYPQQAMGGRFKRLAAIYPSEIRMGEPTRVAPGGPILISEESCDVTADGIANPLGNQFTVNAAVGQPLALLAVVFFYDSVDGVCNPGVEGQEMEGPWPLVAAAMGVRARINPVSGTNPLVNITLNHAVTDQLNVSMLGAPVAGGNDTALTVDAILELGSDGVFTFVNGIGSQSTIGFGGVVPAAGFYHLPAGYEALATLPTGLPLDVTLLYTLRAVSARKVVNGQGQVVGYEAPLSEAFKRDITAVNEVVDGFYGFPTGLSPASNTALGTQRRFAWNTLSRSDGIVALAIHRPTINGTGDVVREPVWNVRMPGGSSSFTLPDLTGAPSVTTLNGTDTYEWTLHGLVFFEEDGFDYNDHVNLIFHVEHWRAHVVSAAIPFRR